ncbi:M20/M25/M40 family metallo-hydrolase [Herbiconiux daphne]|uniref:M20/M25/M40 family metallo-hydrolase n=1 Tax=Herbiconiux daphne TaxID=2970914 RepID=A0ABT2H1Z1_9MICO|nr:M20/M25/M40 family metallo-hydrolase [Herbiconiux daphne]MCS5733950.1 M20/M25/M40 family metallo-hydrolase [Herbiconiux daphne]
MSDAADAPGSGAEAGSRAAAAQPAATSASQSTRAAGDEGALERMRALVRIPTISRGDAAEVDWAAFEAFVAAVEELYPATHGALERELVGGHTLLFRWKGTEAGPASVLMAHYDVVAATDEGWRHPPFAAEVTGRGDDRVLWGRGTLDNKASAVSILEAVERTVTTGFAPRHDLYLLFGHDEEVDGTGAAAVVDLLTARGVRIGLVLDEGGAVVEKLFPTVDRPVAVVGVSEKGTTMFRLTVEQPGGHASTPPRDTATNRLARAIVRLSKRPFPSRINPVTGRMLATVGAHGRGAIRFVFTRVNLFRPLLVLVLSRLTDETAALLHTTIAVTQLSGSLAANALAEQATAVVNARIAIGSTVEGTRRRLERVIADPAVRVEVQSANEPAPVSQMSGPTWNLLSDAITSAYPTAIVTPYVQTGATDSRQFATLSRTVYRFSPFEMSSDERATLHAKDERMSVSTFFTGIRFFEGLIARL